LKKVEEAIGTQKYSGGIQDVWSTARQGLIDSLLVEKDFHFPARLSETGTELIPADGAAAEDAGDAVDDVIGTVLRKGGQVYFCDSGRLAHHNHVAAILRY
jgi:hypothetical protein